MRTKGVTDSDGTVSLVEFSRDDNNDVVGQDIEKLEQDNDGSNDFDLILDANWNVGDHTYLARATDNTEEVSQTVATVGTVIAPNQPPVIGSLTGAPNPIEQDEQLTLTAKGVDDVDGAVDTVDFFRDANEDGAGQDNERIGEDTNASDDFSITLPANLALGDQTFLAQATDNEGAVSALAAEFVTVVQSTEIFTLDTDNGTEVPNRREFIDLDDDRVLVQITGRPGTEATIVLSEGDGDNHQQLISVYLNSLEPQRANLRSR